MPVTNDDPDIDGLDWQLIDQDVESCWGFVGGEWAKVEMIAEHDQLAASLTVPAEVNK